jgi:hypothetical protein
MNMQRSINILVQEGYLPFYLYSSYKNEGHRQASGTNCNTFLISTAGAVLRFKVFGMNNPSVNEDVMAITCSMKGIDIPQ